jgi:DNA processing protein
MVTSAEDIIYLMGWEKNKKTNTQFSLDIDLNEEQKKIVELLQSKHECSIDWLANHAGLKMNTVASKLLELEFMGIVKSLPGKVYRLS